jgi:hypothetical protein
LAVTGSSPERRLPFGTVTACIYSKLRFHLDSNCSVQLAQSMSIVRRGAVCMHLTLRLRPDSHCHVQLAQSPLARRFQAFTPPLARFQAFTRCCGLNRNAVLLCTRPDGPRILAVSVLHCTQRVKAS